MYTGTKTEEQQKKKKKRRTMRRKKKGRRARVYTEGIGSERRRVEKIKKKKEEKA